MNQEPLAGNTRLHIGSLADEALKKLRRERGELLTRLRAVSREIGELELISDAVGVRTVTIPAEVDDAVKLEVA